jgi:cation transport ATPase
MELNKNFRLFKYVIIMTGIIIFFNIIMMTVFYFGGDFIFIDEYSSRVMVRPYYEFLLLNGLSFSSIIILYRINKRNMLALKKRIINFFIMSLSIMFFFQSSYYVEFICVGKTSKEFTNASENAIVRFGIFTIYKKKINVPCYKIEVKKNGGMLVVSNEEEIVLKLYNGGIGSFLSVRSFEESSVLHK